MDQPDVLVGTQFARVPLGPERAVTEPEEGGDERAGRQLERFPAGARHRRRIPRPLHPAERLRAPVERLEMTAIERPAVLLPGREVGGIEGHELRPAVPTVEEGIPEVWRGAHPAVARAPHAALP